MGFLQSFSWYIYQKKKKVPNGGYAAELSSDSCPVSCLFSAITWKVS